MSQLGHKLTHAPQQRDQLYSITSSTIEYTLGGTPMRLRRNTPVKHLVEAATLPARFGCSVTCFLIAELLDSKAESDDVGF